MSTTITQGLATIAPDIVEGYESRSEARTLVHTILGRDEPDITGRPSNLRAGELTLVIYDEIDASDAAMLLRAGGVFDLADTSRPSIDMLFVVSGDVTLTLAPMLNLWRIAFAWQEVT